MKMCALLVISALTCGLCFCRAQSKADLEEVGRKYSNQKYLFSVQLPAGVVAHKMRPPAPQHGFETVPRPKEPYVAIWVDGSYDALDLASSEKLANQAAGHLSASYRLTVAKDSPSHLSGLDARDVVMRGSNGPESINYAHLLVAYRPLPKSIVGIVYTICLQSRSEDSKMEAIFSEIIRSFHLSDLQPDR